MSHDSTRTLMRSVKHFFSGTLLSRLSGLLRDIAMAFAFGTQESVAAFLMAFRFAHLLRRLLGEGAMQSAFTPLFEKLRRSDPAKAARFFIDLSATLTALLIGTIAIGMAGCALCLSLDLVSQGNRDVLTYTMIMLPSLLFICLFGLNASLLQNNHSYFIPGAAPVMFNLVWIAAALFLAGVPIGQAMPWLSGGIILACAAQWALTVPKTIAILKKYDPSSLWRNGKLYSRDVALLAAPLTMAILGVSASQINSALDVIFARYASPEGPAYLWYAIRLQQLPLALFGIAIAGALLPPLTRSIKSGDIAQFRRFLSFSLRRSFALMVPMTAGIFLLGEASIQLLYGHGGFHENSIEGTTQCLWGYGAGLLPMTLALILAPAFYAQENFRLPTTASIISMAVNVALNTWFVVDLGWGPASVAWATSLSAVVNVCVLAYSLNDHFPSVINKELCQSIAKTCLSTMVGSLGVWALGTQVTPQTSLQILTYIGLQTTLFSLLFFGTATLLKAHDVLIWKSVHE